MPCTAPDVRTFMPTNTETQLRQRANRMATNAVAGQIGYSDPVWAIDVCLPMEEVLEILETLDINSRRIECLLESRLAQAG